MTTGWTSGELYVDPLGKGEEWEMVFWLWFVRPVEWGVQKRDRTGTGTIGALCVRDVDGVFVQDVEERPSQK